MPELLEGVQASRDGLTRGIPLTTREELWMEMARQSFKSSATTLSDTLQKLATLTAAMAGGLVILRDPAIPNSWRVAVIISLLASLACAVRGMFPRRFEINLDELADCREVELLSIRHKSFWLKLAGIAFAIAMAIAVAGLIRATLPF